MDAHRGGRGVDQTARRRPRALRGNAVGRYPQVHTVAAQSRRLSGRNHRPVQPPGRRHRRSLHRRPAHHRHAVPQTTGKLMN